jgi:two-component system OmpR family response regulator
MSKRVLQSVLYVDDDPDICEVVRTTLHLIGGLTVHTAGSGEQAIDVAHELRPDVILMDVMMPGLDGPSTFERMRSSPPLASIPVIFVAAKVLPSEVASLLRSGAIGVICKPFDPLALCDDLFALYGNASTCEVARATDGPPEIAAQVCALTNSFLQRAKGDVRRLQEMLEQVRRGEQWELKEIERLAHSMHGAGAMFGFPEVSVSAGAIERLAGAAASTAYASDPGLLQQLLDRTTQLAQRLEISGQPMPTGAGMFQV